MATDPWSMWQLTPDIVITTLITALIYITGMTRRRTTPTQSQVPRHIAFFAGLAVVFLALQSPIDTISEHLFAMHQIQHLLLRMVGPMLIILAAPQGRLISGLPGWARKAILTPIVSSRGVQTVFAILEHPFIVTTLFIGVLYFWEIPRYHDLALLNEPVHYGMHVIMLIAGLLFWWRIFDQRAAPLGLRFGMRLMLLWLALFSNIVLGAFTTLKTTVLYSAYDVLGRFWHIAPSMDERLGGIIIWGPGSMMYVVAMLIVIHLWGRQEGRLEKRRMDAPNHRALWMTPYERPLAVALDAISGRDLAGRQASKNRTLAFGFVGFVFTVLAAVFLVGILSHGAGAGRLEATSQSVVHASTRRPRVDNLGPIHQALPVPGRKATLQRFMDEFLKPAKL